MWGLTLCIASYRAPPELFSADYPSVAQLSRYRVSRAGLEPATPLLKRKKLSPSSRRKSRRKNEEKYGKIEPRMQLGATRIKSS
jgi:hypothetical protein